MAAPMGRVPLPFLCWGLPFSRRSEKQLRLAKVRFNSTKVAAAPLVAGEPQVPVSDVPADSVIGIRKKTFSEILAERQEQAKRSVLINCPSKVSEKKFLKYLSSHGNLKSHFFYETYGLYALVEFSETESIASMQDATCTPQLENESSVPFKSRIFTLTLRNPPSNVAEVPSVPCHPQTTIPIRELTKKLCKANSVNEQLSMLTEMYQLTEENIQLRFLVCSLVQDIVEAYIPDCTVKPFGSSVNTFGKLGCDLDMLLDLDAVRKNMTGRKTGPFHLEYLMRRVPTQRVATQRILSAIGECIDNCGPGCVGVQKILNARCPLVKFSHHPSGFHCDLTANNRIALRSSELLYLYGNLDPRVRALVFSVRCWARSNGITSSIPGAWITNFSLTLMVLFFLQKRKPCIIPTLDELKQIAAAEDKQIIEDNDCTFVSDLNKIQPTTNTEAVDVLLGDFFEYYGNFDFNKYSLNIRKGKEQNKPETSALHIQNPFEKSLNISKNVNATHLERFVKLSQESAWVLQKKWNGSSSMKSELWGLAALLAPSGTPNTQAGGKRNKMQTLQKVKSLLQSLNFEAKNGKRPFGTRV